MKIILCTFISTISFSLFAQETLRKLEDLKGIWVNDEDYRSINIYKELDIISIYDDIGKGEDSGFVSFEEIYFIKKGLKDKKNIHGKDAYTKNLSESSGYFITVNKGQISHLNFIIKEWSDLRFRSNYFLEFNPKYLMVISNVNDHYYHRVHRLPKTALKMLYDRCLEDGVNYILQYLEIDVRNIISEKSFIYDSLEVKTQEYLIKDDLITVTGESGAFLEMEYETDQKKIITGLVRKEDVVGIEPKK